MINLKYSEILKFNKELGNSFKTDGYNISVISNITVNLIKEILEYSLRSCQINAYVRLGGYDNIVQDSLKYNDSKAVIIFWELDNIIDGLRFKSELLDEAGLDSIAEKVKAEIDLTLKNFRTTSLVLVNKFTSLVFPGSNLRKSRFEELTACLNQYMEDKKPENVKFIDLDKVIAQIGVEKSIDLRYYYSSKALYTIDFFKVYTEYIRPFIMSANGKVKKALIFDCDNTLWKGILGEDGFDNIEMSPKTSAGAVFHEVQNMALALSRQGVLIGLCTKNNYEDVNEVITSHPDMLLREEQIVIKKINWLDKAANLREIARELNIGLDSMVYVDDSDFEVNFIKEQLSQVAVLQVTKELYNYPKLIRQNMGLFYSLSLSEENKTKTEMYKQQEKRKNAESKFKDIGEYLASLSLKITVNEDDESVISRAAQMSQKTNQFNLTTKRYTEKDIGNFITDDNSTVFSFSVSDRFGDYGVVGLCIVNIDCNSRRVDIDTFLMSCRVIGRNVEYSFMDYLIDFVKKDNISVVTSRYVQTSKNDQVKNFYENCCFSLIQSVGAVKHYSLDVNNYMAGRVKYIEVNNGREA